MKTCRRHNIAPLALDGFCKNSSDFFGRHGSFEQVLPDPVHAKGVALRLIEVVGAAVAVSVGEMCDAGHQGRKSLFMNRFGGGQGQGAHGPAVEGTEKGDDA